MKSIITWPRPCVSALPELNSLPLSNDSDCIALNLSENPLGCSDRAVQAVARHFGRLHRYPDSRAGALVSSIAAKFHIHEEQVTVGNGIDELLLWAGLTLADPKVGAIICRSTYPGHRWAAMAAGVPVTLVDLDGFRINLALFEAHMRSGVVGFVCNPHNPTGSLLSNDEITMLAESAAKSNAVLVLDEAYAEFRDDESVSIDLVEAGYPLVVMRTFSKIYGLAGLRCGYAIANSRISSELHRIKNLMVFNVNRLALAAAEASLEDDEFVWNSRHYVREVLSDLTRQLNRISGISVLPSSTNFLMVETPKPAPEVEQRMQFRGIRIRSLLSMGFPDHVRVGVGQPNEVAEVADALHNIITKSEE